MIPKVIHYCWFGHGKMSNLALKCIESWKEILPDYEIKEWNEDNFDLDLYPYAREAYDNKKYAFVTDVVRMWALYNDGGIYMDTDVEVLKPLDIFLSNKAFSGFENETSIPTGIMASEKGSKWAKDNLDYYNGRHFVLEDGTLDMTTNVVTITNYMLKYGLVRKNSFQDFPGLVTFYPKDYFCPKDHVTREIHLTKNTYTIHHFDGSWLPTNKKIKDRIRRILGSKINVFIYKYLRKKRNEVLDQ